MKCVALLRGINVAGANKIKMAFDAREKVTTYARQE